MFTGYWWLEALWGVLLIIAPFVEKFSNVRAASYTSVILGIVVLIWAIVGYTCMNRDKSQGMRTSHA
jgi:SPW repeat-containing protein